MPEPAKPQTGQDSPSPGGPACRDEALFSRTFLAWALTVFVLAVLFEILANPRGEFPILVNFQKTHSYNFLDSKFRIIQANLPKSPPRAFILGSSTVIRMNPAIVEKARGLRTFNLGITAAFGEDFYLMTRHAVDGLGLSPRLILVGIDTLAFRGGIETLGENFDNFARLSNSKKFLQYLDAEDQPHRLMMIMTKLRGTVSREYFCAAIKVLTEKRQPWNHRLDENGYLLPFKDDLDISLGDGNGGILQWQRHFTGVKNLSPVRKRYFEKFLKLCRDRGIRLIVFVNPKPECLLRLLRKDPDFMCSHREMTGYLEKLSGEYAFDFCDFTSVKSFGGNDEDFFDGAHYGYYNSDRILEKLLEVCR